MSDTSTLDRAKRNASGIAATTVTGTWLAALMLGFDWWLAALLFGYIVIVPVVAMLFDEEEEKNDEETERKRAPTSGDATADGDSTADSTADALDRLRDRYAAGELSDEAFETKLERLLETETIEDARAHVERERAGTASTRTTGNVETTENDAARAAEGDTALREGHDAARERDREPDRG